VADQLAEYAQKAEALTDETKRDRVVARIGEARRRLLGRLDTEADTLAGDLSRGKQGAARDPLRIEQQDQAVERDEDLLADHLVQIREALGLVDPQAVSAEQADDVRDQAFQALAKEMRTDHTWTATLAVVDGVLDRMRPLGLRGLEVAPGSSGEDAVVYAEASARAPVARLKGHAAKPAGRSVTARTELRLAEVVDVPEGGFAPAGGIPTVRTGGRVLSPSPGAPEIVRVETWNTSNLDLNRIGNVSHAEHQFVKWLRAEYHLMPLIEEIVVRVSNLMPCSGCSEDLTLLLDQIKAAQDKAGRRRIRGANLYWTEFYEGTKLTASWQDVNNLNRSGWTLHAPLQAYPPEESSTRQSLKLIEHGFWTLEGGSLAPPVPRAPAALGPGEEHLTPGVIRRRGRSK
jgi:hypothetical protein